MKAHFQKLYRYNQWANDLFANVLGKEIHTHPKINLFFGHIALAQLFWLNRIQPIEKSIPGVFKEMPLTESAELLTWGNELFLSLIDTISDCEAPIHYTTTTGEQHTTLLKDILTHVANHGTHHRGQIALLLREEGIEPPASDFIFYIRD